MSHDKTFTDDPKLDPKAADRAFKILTGVGVVGMAASFGLGLTGDDATRATFFSSYLVAFMLFCTISIGALFFIIIHHLTRAQWSASTRRIAENFAINIPLMAILFIPILIGMHDLYHWSHAEAVELDPILKWKSGYLNATAFIIRAVVFFAIWSVMAWFFRSNSIKQDATGDEALSFKMRKGAPVSMLLFALTVSFASFDWLMSLDPHWFSTMFGLYQFSGAVVTFFAATILAAAWLKSKGALKNTITIGNTHDLGKMMFGFIIFWAYVTFSQYYLIWYANIPEETVWYALRSSHGWEKIGLLVIVGHFIVPFWFLLSRNVKRKPMLLALGAAWMVLMHFVDLYYVVKPTFGHHGPHFSILDITTVLGVGGLFLGAFAYRFKKDAAVAYRDPQLIAAMGYDNG
jgi:hypothetical protein